MKLNKTILRRMILKEIRLLKETNSEYIKGQVTDQAKANMTLRWASSPPDWMMARGPDEGYWDDYDEEWVDDTRVLLNNFGGLWDRAFGQTYRLTQGSDGNIQYHPGVESMALEILKLLEGWHSGTDPQPFIDMSKLDNVGFSNDDGDYKTMTIYAQFANPDPDISGKVDMGKIRDFIGYVIDCIKSAGYLH
jgi:hypothetical protein